MTKGKENLNQVYLNQGQGYARGIELSVKHRAGDRFFSWANYTYSVSKREDRPGEMERLYSFDQPHVATVTASYMLTPTWEIGAKWQYRTGNPYTPVVDAEIVRHPDTGPASLQPDLRRNQLGTGADIPPLRPSYQQVVHLSAVAMGDSSLNCSMRIIARMC